MVLVFRKEILSIGKKYIVFSVIAGMIAVFPMIFFTLSPLGLQRAQGASFMRGPTQPYYQKEMIRLVENKQKSDLIGMVIDNRRVVYTKTLLSNYLSHYNLNWLFIKGDTINKLNTNLRYQATEMGNIYLVELPFLLIGIFLVCTGFLGKKIAYFLLGWFLLVPIPATLTWDVPSSVRTLNFLPLFQIFVALGIIFVLQKILRIKYKILNFKVRYLIIVLGILIFLFNIIYYLDQYFVQYNYFAAKDWQYGYAKLIPEIKNRENSYKEIIVSSEIPLDQSYIFFLFYQKYPPSLYQKEFKNASGEHKAVHMFDKYIFRPIDLVKETPKPQALYVVGGDLAYKGFRILETIYYPDGKAAFSLMDRNF